MNHYQNMDIAELTILAEKGNLEAQYHLGEAIISADKSGERRKEAFYWIEKAAKCGLPKAEYKLGLMYFNGEGTNQNSNTALLWFEKASVNNDPMAKDHLEKILKNSNDYPLNLQEIKVISDYGIADYQYLLGLIYLWAFGIGRNFEKGIELLKKAAEQGHAKAQYKLGFIYECCPNEETNELLSIHWYEKALKSGLNKSQIYSAKLGLKLLYERKLKNLNFTWER